MTSLFVSCSKTNNNSNPPEEIEPKTYTITWQNYDGSILEFDTNVSDGEIPSYDGATPTKPDNDEHYYVFDGWSPTVYPAVQDTTYTAKFLEENYIYHTVTFNSNGGSPIESQRVKHGEKAIKPSDPIKEGHSFSNWTYNNSEWLFNDCINEDMNLTANWDVNCYSITWLNYDGAVLKVDEVPYGTTPTYTGETPTKPDSSDRTYSFNGWLPEVADVKQNATYIAVFSEDYIYHTVTFNSNGGSPIESQRVKHGDKIKRPEDPTKEGNHLVSWRYQNEDWSFAGYVVTEDMTLVADWGHNQYAINKIGGSGAGTSLVSYDENYCLGTSLKDGYTFTGWYSEAYCQGTKYTDESGNSINKYNLLQDLTLYAGFTYTVTFQTNGGSLLQPITLNENETIPSDVETVRDNSSFAGWYSDSKLVNEVDVNEPLSGSLTLYAKWDDETGTRFFDYFVNDDGTLTITNCIYYGSDLFIPQYINGCLVSSIKSNAFIGCDCFLSIFVPDTITSIGNGAFQNCSSLQSITLPFVGGSATTNQYLGYIFGATSYSDNLNYVPTSLKTVIISNNCTSIAKYAFYDCSSLRSLTLPFVGGSATTNQYLGYVFGKSKDYVDCLSLSLEQVVLTDKCNLIPCEGFYNCSSLTSIVIPNGMAAIGADAFYGCSSLNYNEYDNGMYLGNDHNPYLYLAKAKNTSITSCEINCDCEFVGGNAFKDCQSLAYNIYENGRYLGNDHNPYLCLIKGNQNSDNVSYKINNECKFILDSAFENYTSLSSIIIPDSVVSIGSFAFSRCIELTTVTIGNNVTSIGALTFFGCSKLTSITIPNNVIIIAQGAFSYCSSLTSINLPDGITSIGNSVFSGCSSLTSINLPDGITSIGISAFYYCSSLALINIPDSVISIGQESFAKCSSLTSIIIPVNVMFIDQYAFSGCSLLTIYCEASSEPEDWSYWNPNDCPVVWGYKGE